MARRPAPKIREATIRHPMPPVPCPQTLFRKAILVALRWKITLSYRARDLAPFRSWLRGVGAAGILLGTVGLMHTFFWPSVCAFYAGLGVLALDLFAERIGPYLKGLVVTSLIITASLFTREVVLHNTPFDLSYTVNGTNLDLIVSNNSPADDYRDIDLTIIPVPGGHNQIPSAVIGSFRELTAGTPCSVISSPYQLTEYPTFVMATPHGYAIYQSAERLRCELLPHRDMLEFEVQLVRRVLIAGQNAVVPVTPTADPEFKISFTGKFRDISAAGQFQRER